MKMNQSTKIDHSLKKWFFLFLIFSALQVFGYTKNTISDDAALSTFVNNIPTFTSNINSGVEIINLEKSTSLMAPPVITGDLRRYHKLTFTWDGPNLSEEDATYSDYRLDVTFTSPSGKTYVVPGYFAADGNAGETSAISGNKWRCHFNALELGEYTYEVSFLSGANIAVDFDISAGTPIPSTHGDTGSFTIEETNKSGIDFRSKGKLEYVGEHFMQWTTGEYYLKMGSNSPENLFEYVGFDDSNSNRTFPAHVNDWNPGDPTWKNDQGKGMIGAINYLSSKGINSQYYVLHRKGEKASPWQKPFESHATYDVSKMDQWQIVFDHMMEKGLMAHIVFSESTNQSFFEVYESSGDPNFSDKRKIYFREMVARFGYLNAVTWNIGEENGWDRRTLDWAGEDARALTTKQQLDFTKYVDDLAYYNDFITVHNGPSHTTAIYDDLQGNNSITGTSLQGFFNNDERATISVKRYRNESALSGKKWVIYYDEAFTYRAFPDDAELFRRNVLWTTLTSGGAGMEHFTTRFTNELGVEVYLDITNENLRYSEEPFQLMKHTYDFYIDNNIPFYNMYNQDEIVDQGFCHGDEFQNYVIYVKKWTEGPTTIDLVGEYEVKWYNPREGGALQDGTVTSLTTGQDLDLGDPPSELEEDWVIYLKNSNGGLVPVTDVELNPKDYHLGVGVTYTLNAEVFPENADNKEVLWSSSDPSVVTVFSSEGTITGVSPGTAVITVTTVDGGFIEEATITVVANTDTCEASGSILVEKYDNIETGKLSFLLNAPNYPDNPDSTYELTEFEIPKTSLEDSYGLRVSGFLCPPETGLYTFWISGDDQVQLSISGDNQFQNANRVAWHDSFTDVREWDKFTSQRSQEILLYQGQSYYIEALLKEGEFGDHMAVGWRKPSDGPGNEPAELVPGDVLSTRELGRNRVTDISLNVPNADLRLGEMLQLVETISPVNASEKGVIWTSANEAVASVDQAGNITGEAIGSTVITVTTIDGNLQAQAIINVIDDVIPVASVSVTPTETNLVLNGTLVLEATVLPADATNKDVIWTSADPSIVEVDENGELLGISFGTTVITVSTVDGGFTAQSTVTVVENSQINVTGVQLNVESANIEIGQTQILEATITPMNATNSLVVWSSEDSAIVSVDSNGEILGVAAGTAVINVTSEDGNFTAQATITVVDNIFIGVTGISINPDTVDLELESSLFIDATVQPSDASDKSLIWFTEDETIVTVDDNGQVVGIALGTTVVTATTIDGEFVAQVTITVVEKTNGPNGIISVTGISIEIDDLVLKERDIVQIIGTVLPENASNDYILWVPLDPSIVIVDSNGNVEAKKVGETILTATTLDGGFSKTITVTVLPNNIIVHPNPTSDFINIEGTDERIDVFIYDSSGVLVKSAKGGSPIYVGGLSNGSYVILLKTGHRIRFVKR